MKHNKQETLLAEKVLTSLLATMPGHLYWKNAQGIYLGCNNDHAQRLGLKKGTEAVGKTDVQLLKSEDGAQPYFSYCDELVLSEGETKIIEEVVTLRGRTVILLSLKSPILEKKKQVLGMLSISLDITRERRLEEKVCAVNEESTASSSFAKRILIVKMDKNRLD